MVKPLGELTPDELGVVMNLVSDAVRQLPTRIQAVRKKAERLQGKCLKESSVPIEDLRWLCMLRMLLLPDEDHVSLTEEEVQALKDDRREDAPGTDIIPLMVDYLISEEGRTLREDLLDRILDRAQEAKRREEDV